MSPILSPPREQADACENITFQQLRLRAVKKHYLNDNKTHRNQFDQKQMTVTRKKLSITNTFIGCPLILQQEIMDCAEKLELKKTSAEIFRTQQECKSIWSCITKKG